MFKNNFFWGVAEAGFQVERTTGTADWDVFTGNPAIVSRYGDTSEVTMGERVQLVSPGDALSHDMIEIFKLDLDRARALGINAFRFSIEWSRVQPTKDSAWDENAFLFYLDVLRAIRQREMRA